MKLTSFDAIAIALQSTGVRYVIAGGMAVNAHGDLRSTQDVNIAIRLDAEKTSSTLSPPWHRWDTARRCLLPQGSLPMNRSAGGGLPKRHDGAEFLE